MEDIDLTYNFLKYIIGCIDITYVVGCNALTWVILTTIDSVRVDTLNIKKKLPKWIKIIIASLVAGVLGYVRYKYFSANLECIITSFFIQFLTWDYFFKIIIKELQGLFRKKSS